MRNPTDLTVTQAPGVKKASAIRYRFRITIEGVVLLIVMVLVGFAAWHSGTNLLYLLFAILISFYLAHGGMLWLNLRKLNVTATAPETVTAGQPFDLVLILNNGKSFVHSYALQVSIYPDGEKPRKAAVSLSTAYFPVVFAGTAEKQFQPVRLGRRGLCKLSRVMVATRYPFCFEERASIRECANSILVLPATFNVSDILNNKVFGLGDQESNERGPGTDLYGLREYAPGDHARSIHWKTSARARKLIVSEFARDERKQVMLLLDNSLPAEVHAAASADFENAITLTASMARHLINAGFEVGLTTADEVTSVAQGSVQLFYILKHLALLQLTDKTPVVSQEPSVLQIEFADRPAHFDRPSRMIIDSRTWRPDAGNDITGEKYL